jgi:hypothetical protein
MLPRYSAGASAKEARFSHPRILKPGQSPLRDEFTVLKDVKKFSFKKEGVTKDAHKEIFALIR